MGTSVLLSNLGSSAVTVACLTLFCLRMKSLGRHIVNLNTSSQWCDRLNVELKSHPIYQGPLATRREKFNLRRTRFIPSTTAVHSSLYPYILAHRCQRFRYTVPHSAFSTQCMVRSNVGKCQRHVIHSCRMLNGSN